MLDSKKKNGDCRLTVQGASVDLMFQPWTLFLCTQTTTKCNNGSIIDASDNMFGKVAGQSIAAIRAAGSIPSRTKYLYSLEITVLSLGVCARPTKKKSCLKCECVNT